jgi:hypothetical protein
MKNFPLTFRTGTFVLALGLSTAALLAQDKPKEEAKSDSKAPPAKEVIARFLKEVGGREAILKHSSTRVKGKWEIAAMGQGGEFELLRAKPDKQMMIIRVGDQAEIRQGFDGKVGWMTNPFGGPMILSGKMLDQTREEADFYNILRDEKNYKSMETVGISDFNGKKAIELKLVSKSGREVREFYDPQTGLLVGSRGVQESAEGPGEVTITFSDYKKLGGQTLQPTRLGVKTAAFEQSITMSSAEYDTLSDKDFVLPDEIQALLKK